MEDSYSEMKLISSVLQLKLLKGELNWEDEHVQFFIPAALFFTDFDWLNIIAENILVDEDEKVVKNFLSQVESLVAVNSENLNNAMSDTLNGLMK